ncbi:MAG: alpha/beta hydrolase [Deltaproteobacteria bacterium]|nr:alpha/beta hydrolase [Deltaproteobacteria bacterium]
MDSFAKKVRSDGIPEKVFKGCRNIGAIPFMDDMNGLDLFWAEKGEGYCLLAVHGFSSCFYTWRSLFKGLGKGFRVVTPDLPGFGCSGDPLNEDYSLESYCRVLEAFAERQRLGPLTLCGHSYGGLICWMLAARCPELVERIILVSPSVPRAERSSVGNVDNLMLYAYSDLSVLDSIAFDVYRAANIRTPGPLKRLQRFPDVPSLSEERELPCLMIWGSEDRIIPPSNAEGWCNRHPGTLLEVFYGAGHCPHEESPDLFVRKVRVFLQQDKE